MTQIIGDYYLCHLSVTDNSVTANSEDKWIREVVDPEDLRKEMGLDLHLKSDVEGFS